MLSLQSWLTLIYKRLITPKPARRQTRIRQFFPVACVERLEQRQLLSGTAILNGTTLEIIGSSQANTVNVTLSDPATLDVDIDGTHSSFLSALVADITIDGQEGNDTLTIANSVTQSSTLTGGDGNDTMTAGGGNSTMIGGIGNDWYVFKNATSAQADTVVEQANEGTDSIYLNAITDAVIVDLTSDGTLATMTNRTVQTGAAGQAAHFEKRFGTALTGLTTNSCQARSGVRR